MDPISSSSIRILPAEADSSSLSTNGSSGAGFREVLGGAIDDIQNLESAAQEKVAGVLEGTGTDVHSAMIAVEKADLSFQLMMQVRNKIISAYEEISRMQF
jgi:flagellar hook-basal body complex protein FliE